MATCIRIVGNGTPCHNLAQEGSAYCGHHPVPVEELRVCNHELTTGGRCDHPRAADGEWCTLHNGLARRRQERQNLRTVWIEVLEIIWNHRDANGARVHLTNAFTNHRLTEAQFVELAPMLDEEVEFMEETWRHEVVPRSELHAFVLDRQNVHTPATNKQTQEGLDMLLDTDIPSGQDTLGELGDTWTQHEAPMVLYDMNEWYTKISCRAQSDHLYKRTLDGLWARVKASPMKEELLKRLWEECSESVGTCCEGHISRLCNVLVGFDDTFKAPVSLGEVLQQRMAAIAAKDIHVHYKVEEAWAVFEELSVPRDQRKAWVEAF